MWEVLEPQEKVSGKILTIFAKSYRLYEAIITEKSATNKYNNNATVSPNMGVQSGNIVASLLLLPVLYSFPTPFCGRLGKSDFGFCRIGFI